MKWLAKFEYGTDPDVLEATRELPPWTVLSRGIGDSDESAAGVGAAIRIRQDRMVAIDLEFFESEWAAYEHWFNWAQLTMQPFGFWFDKDDDDTEWSLKLHEPLLGDGGFEPVRTAYPGVYSQRVVLRSADGSVITTNWSGE